ncbi:hypothetical protein K439DRAFT_1662069 [Ramaria rubella]|nr:hypothetical protein K439DRAFT_1662069 [Ramaria rubella]
MSPKHLGWDLRTPKKRTETSAPYPTPETPRRFTCTPPTSPPSPRPAKKNKPKDNGDQTENVHGSDLKSLAEGLKGISDAAGVPQLIDGSAGGLVEKSEVLLKVLGEVQKIHPYISALWVLLTWLLCILVVVVGFKLILEIMVKVKGNQAKVVVIITEIKDMTDVLQRLGEITKPVESQEDRLKSLVGKAADDIKECAENLDEYLRMSLFERVIKSVIWEERLAKFVTLFRDHRDKLNSAINLSTRIFLGILHEDLRHVSEEVHHASEEVTQGFQDVKNMIAMLASPEERKLAMLAEEARARDPSLTDEAIVQRLSKESNQESVSFQKWKASKLNVPIDPDKAIEENRKRFSAKYEAKFTEELSRCMERLDWPHDRVKDEDMRHLWDIMNWRGSVKSHRFAMTLRDYFHESWRYDVNARPAADKVDEAKSKPDSGEQSPYEAWAVDAIQVSRMQPIIEAFDDDLTGFITVVEVNSLTCSRPRKRVPDCPPEFNCRFKDTDPHQHPWSLEHWIAYWAIGISHISTKTKRRLLTRRLPCISGWQQSLLEYASKIREIIANMFAILPDILELNRGAVNRYLQDIYPCVTALECAVNAYDGRVCTKFYSYVQTEEMRLRQRLELLNYDIDDVDTVALVTGPGRIEQYILPLLYLILKRQFEILRLCRTIIVDPVELPDATSTIRYVLQAFKTRFKKLRSIFQHRRLDVKRQFHIFAHGLFKYIYEPSGLWTHALVRDTRMLEFTYRETAEQKWIRKRKKTDDPSSASPTAVLNHPVSQTYARKLELALETPVVITTLLSSSDSLKYPTGMPADPLLFPDDLKNCLLGTWYGFRYRNRSALQSQGGMITLCFQQQDRTIKASGLYDFKKFNIIVEGREAGMNVIDVNFRSEVVGDRLLCWSGQLHWSSDPKETGVTDAITGTLGTSLDSEIHDGIFVLKRTIPEKLRFRPSPAAFHTDKAKALWKFAGSAIRFQVRKQSWSKLYFAERLREKTQFIDLYLRWKRQVRPQENSDKELFRHLRNTLIPEDNRFYRALAELKLKKDIGFIACCANCGEKIQEARIICLTCTSKDSWFPVDLCEAAHCSHATIDRDDLMTPHFSTHDTMKVRRVVHLRQMADLECAAGDALERVKTAFERPIPRVQCTCCMKDLKLPWSFWYCIQCPKDIVICDECDRKLPVSFSNHKPTHDLVRYQQAEENEDAQVANYGLKLDNRLSSMDTVLLHMNERLSRVENLLREAQGGSSDSSPVVVDVKPPQL